MNIVKKVILIFLVAASSVIIGKLYFDITKAKKEIRAGHQILSVATFNDINRTIFSK